MRSTPPFFGVCASAIPAPTAISATRAKANARSVSDRFIRSPPRSPRVAGRSPAGPDGATSWPGAPVLVKGPADGGPAP